MTKKTQMANYQSQKAGLGGNFGCFSKAATNRYYQNDSNHIYSDTFIIKYQNRFLSLLGFIILATPIGSIKIVTTWKVWILLVIHPAKQ